MNVRDLSTLFLIQIKLKVNAVNKIRAGVKISRNVTESGFGFLSVGENYSYAYNTWITKKYRGLGIHLNLRSFREMERIGKDSIIHDVEIWNKYTIVHCIKSLKSDIIDFLER